MHITVYSLGHRLLCEIFLYKLHHESPGCCCTGATLERHHDYVIWHYVMATLWLSYSGCYNCCVSQERGCLMVLNVCCASQQIINMSAIPMAPWVSFQPLSLHLAYSGFSKQCRKCEQQDHWPQEQDQLYNLHRHQDTQQIGEPEATLDQGSQWPPYSK